MSRLVRTRAEMAPRPFWTAAIAVCALGLICSPVTVAAASSPAVTPADTPGLVAAYSATNNHANETLNAAIQARGESGTSLFIDDSNFTFERRAGFANLDGVGTYYKFSYTPFASAVPPDLTTGGSFAVLAHVTYPKSTPRADRYDAGATTLLVFRRTTASPSWRVTLYPAMTTSFGSFSLTPSGYANPAVTTGRQFGVSKIPSEIAAALSTYASTGSLTKGLSLSAFSYAKHPWVLPNLRKYETGYRRRGFKEKITVTPYANADVHTYALVGGDTLVTFSERIVYRISFPKGFVVQTSVRGQPDTWEIGAGKYSWVKFPAICEMAALDPPAPTVASSSKHVPVIVGAACGDVLGATGARL